MPCGAPHPTKEISCTYPEGHGGDFHFHEEPMETTKDPQGNVVWMYAAHWVRAWPV